MIGWILGLFNPLKRILDSIDNRVDNDTRRVEITADVQKSFYMAQVQIATTSGRYLMNFIGFTFALHAFAVVMYSIFFCSRCMAPQTWVVVERRTMGWFHDGAALEPPDIRKYPDVP